MNMNSLWVGIQQEWHSFVSYLPRFALALLVILASYYTGKYFARIILVFLRRSSISTIHYTFFRVVSIFLVLFVGFLISLNILGLEKFAVSLLASGGATAVILGFAFREIGENFLAGLFLAFSRPFNIGDTIRTEEFEGEVRNLELRYTHIRTDDGRDLYIPSSQLFNRPVTNFTKDGLRRISFSVGIDYANDAKAACSLLAKEAQSVRGVLNEPPTGAFISSLASDYVELTIFFWVDVFDKSMPILSIRIDVMDSCRKALLDNGYIVSSETTSNHSVIIKEKEK